MLRSHGPTSLHFHHRSLCLVSEPCETELFLARHDISHCSVAMPIPND